VSLANPNSSWLNSSADECMGDLMLSKYVCLKNQLHPMPAKHSGVLNLVAHCNQSLRQGMMHPQVSVVQGKALLLVARQSFIVGGT
jgi:hypothetical protein